MSPGSSSTASIRCPRCDASVAEGSRFCPACGAAMPASVEQPADDHLIGRLREAMHGEYDVLREIGHGGMAAVYLAWDRGLARYVAIKVLLPELAHHPTMSQRFLQEARTAANLDDHPSVVRVYRAKEAQGLRFFVMKYVDGCSLEQLLRSAGPLPPDLTAHIVDQVALALQYAHERGVVHRDVKPGNVLLDRSGHVVVTDFGIAKVAEAEQLTRTGFAIGTPHYMSPEQWRVEPLTPASDQYALGVVAYQSLTGAVPFDGTQYAIQEQHLHAAPPETAAHMDGPSDKLGAVVRRMLAKAPRDRYPDLRSVSLALAAIPRDAAPVLRERLSRLIPAANTPGVREVPPPGVPAVPAEVVVERRGGEAAAMPASATTVVRPPSSPGAVRIDDAADDARDAALPPGGEFVARPLEGPISQRYPPPRSGPWLAATGVVALLVGGGAALRARRAPPAAGAGAARPAAMTGLPARADSTAAAAAATDSAAFGPAPVHALVTGDSASATDSAAAPPGAPATLFIFGGPSRGTLTVASGDSVRLRARVNDARGTRVTSAVVQWASSDPARVAFRNGWAVALAPGGPVAVTATSGPFARSVRLAVMPRAAGIVPATASRVARPTPAELRAEVGRFVAALGARDVDEVARRLAPRAVDGSSSREFVQWLADTEGLAAGAPALGEASDEGNRARVAFRVPLRLGDRGRKDVTFWMTFAHDEQGWHGGEVLLGGRVAP